jgi:tetratricopeptide (TPR) repeat protein
MIHIQNYRRAIEDLDYAIELNPSYSEAFVNRGLAYAHQKDYRAQLST